MCFGYFTALIHRKKPLKDIYQAGESEILTDFNIILALKVGFYHQNLSLKFYAWIINEFKIP